MANVSAALVKELRNLTGLGMMECKKSLVESEGDIDRAIRLLRQSSAINAATKAGRTAAEGVVAADVSVDAKSAVLIEINCETDFVAKDESFLAFVNDVLVLAQSDHSITTESVLAGSLAERRERLVQKIGENISVRRMARLNSDGCISSYIHNNKIAALVALDKVNTDLGKDLAMHIVASNPLAIDPEDVDAELLANERVIYQSQAAQSGKPQNIIDNIVSGKLRKYLAEVSLTQQKFVKDTERKIEDLLKRAECMVTGFVRFEVGEGIQKPVTDFAKEVRHQSGL